MKTKILMLFLSLVLLLSGCETGAQGENGEKEATFDKNALASLGAYDGYFDGASEGVTVHCESGTPDAYTLKGTTLTFTAIDTDSVYSISGSFRGNIVIDVGDDFQFDLALHGLRLISEQTNPITVLSGDKVTIIAKKDTESYLYDVRAAIDTDQNALYSSAIHSDVDLVISGKGALTVISENNNGIHTKDDLKVKNLTLLVACVDNALKGNDSVEIEKGRTTLIAAGGDCIKTKNSDVSSKGNQRGCVVIKGGIHDLYAACDGIDAAYDVSIEGSATALNIHTAQYSSYTQEGEAIASDTNYIRFTSNDYYYSVKYYNSDTDYVWVNAEYHSKVSGGRGNYYYYSYPKMQDYAKQQFFIYESKSQLGQEEEYLVMSDYLTTNDACDTFALINQGDRLSYEWTNYATTIWEGGFGGMGRPGAPGAMNDGNTDKGDHSTKGIKAANEIVIHDGTVDIKSYDDAIHAGGDDLLENGEAPLGNVTVSGGYVTVYTNDDGLHADGTLSVTAGTVRVTQAYEGLEGAYVKISGGDISIVAKDDGVNATATSGAGISVSGGTLYIHCHGDGMDSNSRTSYQGIVFSGGKTVIIANANGNSAIDSDSGYSYTGGSVVALMTRGGMANEAMRCKDFSSVGAYEELSLSAGEYLLVEMAQETATVQMPIEMHALVIVLGDALPRLTVASSSSVTLDANGVAWH